MVAGQEKRKGRTFREGSPSGERVRGELLTCSPRPDGEKERAGEKAAAVEKRGEKRAGEKAVAVEKRGEKRGQIPAFSRRTSFPRAASACAVTRE